MIPLIWKTDSDFYRTDIWSKNHSFIPFLLHTLFLACHSLHPLYRIIVWISTETMAQLGQAAPPPTFIPAWDAGPRDESQIARQDLPPMYEFRQGVRASGKVAPTAWLDQDKSGNYKPKLNVHKPRTRRAPRPRKDITLEPTSERPNDEVAAIYERESHSKLSKPDAPSKSHGHVSNGESDPSPVESSTLIPARYRKRNRKADVPCPQDETFTTFDGFTPEDAAARSCKSCFSFGVSCSLLAEGSQYPCDLCIAEGEDCDLMREPQLKQPCLSCKRRDFFCSFKKEPDRMGPCDSCIKSATHCVAGPLDRRSTVRSKDRRSAGLARMTPQQRRPVLPIQRTRRGLVGLEYRNVVPKFYSRRKYTSQAVEFASFRDYDHVISRKNLSSNASTGLFQSIVTRFAHPISFNYKPPNPLELSCHWCNDILYGLLGLGPVEVEVLDYRNGGGYKEIENGHACAGHMPSRMCIKCTLARLTIAACTCHEVELIEGVNPDAFTYSAFKDYLVPGMTDFAPFEWCCICPTPASFQCLKPQEPDELCPNPPDSCGLLLCERCASFLMGRHSGVLERLIDGLKLEFGESALRADAEFLHPKGELLRRINNAGGVS